MTEHRIVCNDLTVNSFQKHLTGLDNLYHARYCSGRSRQWNDTYHQATGEFIPESDRKPYFEGGLPKKIVDTFTSELFGLNKFPNVVVKAKESLYALKIAQNTDNILDKLITDDNISSVDQNGDKTISKEEVRRHLLSNSKRMAEECLAEIIKNSFIKLESLRAARKAFIMGRSFIVAKVSGGDYHLQVKDIRWISDIKYDPKSPRKIISFTEKYVYEGVNAKGESTNYIYRCDYDKESEKVFFPVEFKGWGNSYSWSIDVEKSTFHNIGFCPAIEFSCEDGVGILEDHIDNLLSYMYVGSDAYRGVKTNMDPQWALTVEKGQTVDVRPRVKGNIWAFEGKAIQAITVGVGGYQEARNIKMDLKYEILETSRIQVVPVANDQSAEAIRLRMKPQTDATGEYRLMFGERALLKLFEMMLKMAVILSRNGHILSIADSCVIPDDENGFSLELVWPQIETVTIVDMYQAVQMVMSAIPKGSAVLTEDVGIDLLSLFLPIQNVEHMKRELSKMRAEQKKDEKEFLVLEVVEKVLAIIQQKQAIQSGELNAAPVGEEEGMANVQKDNEFDGELKEITEKVVEMLENKLETQVSSIEETETEETETETETDTEEED